MRALGPTRLSHKTDESTSIVRQTEQITLTAKIRGDTLVRITEDTDISGSVSPFLREGLGPWLTEQNKIDQWDVLIVSKVDRLTRSLSDFDDLVAWLDRNGKTLVSVSESLDLSNSTGRMFANLLAMFAQFERDRMSERRQEAAVKIRENGWWAGFGFPYGTRPVKVDTHWELEINPETYARLEQIAWEIIKGHSRSSIAKRLNATQIPTPAGGKEWRQNTIADIFTSDKCVLDPDLLVRVREALDTTKQTWTKRGDAAMLLNVGYCQCGAALYSKRYESKGRQYEYYDCSANCGARRIPMVLVESAVDAFMTDSETPPAGYGYAGYPLYRKITHHGKSNKGEVNAIERKIRSLNLDDRDYQRKHDELMAQRRHLIENFQTEPDATVYEEIPDMTVGNYWPTLDRQSKRQLLLEAGVKVTDVKRRDGYRGGANVVVVAPVDVKFIMLPSGDLATLRNR
jgi:DNA invertase Pin-like site-specific DNA recombinase